MRTRRLLAVATVVVALGLGGAAVAAAADGGSGTPTTPAGTGTAGSLAAAGPSVCDRLAERVAEVPGIRARIRERLGTLEARIEAVRSPVLQERLRARLQPRIDALQALDDRLAAQVARVEERCPGAV